MAHVRRRDNRLFHSVGVSRSRLRETNVAQEKIRSDGILVAIIGRMFRAMCAVFGIGFLLRISLGECEECVLAARRHGAEYTVVMEQRPDSLGHVDCFSGGRFGLPCACEPCARHFSLEQAGNGKPAGPASPRMETTTGKSIPRATNPYFEPTLTPFVQATWICPRMRFG